MLINTYIGGSKKKLRVPGDWTQAWKEWECQLRRHAEINRHDIHPNYGSVLETGTKTKDKRLFSWVTTFISGPELC